MLDLTSTTSVAALAPGDITLFRFPVAEGTDDPATKVRPCLVFDRRTYGGDEFIDLAYGTTSRSRANAGYELHVTRRRDIDAAGLTSATRFICARRVLVQPHHPGFLLPEGRDPFVGRISPDLMLRLQELQGKVRQALVEGWRSRPKLTVLDTPSNH
jgi:hypothetical protein